IMAAAHSSERGGTIYRVLIPLAVIVAIFLVPVPEGLPRHAWYYFAIFSGVIAALVAEPLPAPAIGLIGVTLVTVLAKWVLFAPADQAKPGFNSVDESLRWALSGFSSSTVWLPPGVSVCAPLPTNHTRARPR